MSSLFTVALYKSLKKVLLDQQKKVLHSHVFRNKKQKRRFLIMCLALYFAVLPTTHGPVKLIYCAKF